MELAVFEFNGLQVRFVGTPEVPEWVAGDVIDILYPESDRRNRSNYLAKVEDEWKRHKKLMTSTGSKGTTTILEPGLYQLILGSNSPLAKPFQKWVFEEVLPSIRKTGKYEIKRQRKVLEARQKRPTVKQLADVVKYVAGNLLSEHELSVVTAKAIGEARPELALAADNAIQALPAQEHSEQLHSPKELGNMLGGLSAQKVNKLLKAIGLQDCHRDAKERIVWEATPMGEPHSAVKYTTKDHDKTSVQVLRWKPSVIPLLQEHISTNSTQH